MLLQAAKLIGFGNFFTRALSSNVVSNQKIGKKPKKRPTFDGSATIFDSLNDLSLITCLVDNLSTEHILHILNSKKIPYDLTGISGVRIAQPRLYRERITTAVIDHYRSRIS